MTQSTPPFDPPYFTQATSPDGKVVWTETLANGTTREVADRASTYERGTKPNMPRAVAAKTAPQKPQSPPFPHSGTDKAALFLDVPFSHKDEAKALGAKWDSAMKKWYVPHGADINKFSRWWPTDLKHESAWLGQL